MGNESEGRPAASAQNAQLVASFSAHLHGVRAAGTRKKYVHATSELSAWTGDRLLSELTLMDLENYRSWFLAEFESAHSREPTRATVRNRLVAIRVFYAYLDRNGLLSSKSPAEHLELPVAEQKDIDFLSAAEVEALIATPMDLRERIIISLVRWTGMRVDEARNVLISDLHLTPGSERIIVRVTKTPSGKRTVFLAPELIPQIQEWLTYLQSQGRWKSNLPLLSTSSGKPMASQYIWRVVKRVAYRAGVRPVECTCGSNTKSFHSHDCAQSSTGGELIANHHPHIP